MSEDRKPDLTARKNVRWVQPPAFLVAIAALAGVIGIGMTAIGSQTIGVSTDEPGHVRRTSAYLKSGLYIRSFEADDTAANGVPIGAYVYGPITSLFQHDVQRLLGTEPNWSVTTRPKQYAIRHAIIAITSIVGLLAAAAIGSLVLGSWRWGVVSGGVLAAVPLWTGQGMFNMKDVPVATGHTCLTLGLVLLALSNPATKLRGILAASVVFMFGTLLMVGTRPGTWPSLLASLIILSVIVLRSRGDQTRGHRGRIVGALGVSLVVVYAGLLAVYPRVFSDLPRALYLSALGSANYSGLGDQPPAGRAYLFSHALTDLPLGLVTLMVAGTGAAIVLPIVRRRSVELDCLALVGSQAFALTGASIVLSSAFYDGLRQTLFAIPALAVMATVGVAALLTKLPAGRLRLVAAIGVCFAIVLPTAAQGAMFPYQYSYINAFTTNNRAGADYFGTSFKEYAHNGPQDVKVTCPFLHYGGAAFRDDSDCRTKFSGTFSAYWRGRPTPDRPRHVEFYTILRGSRPTPPNCTVYRRVERWQNLGTAVMSSMFKCHDPSKREVIEGNIIRNHVRMKVGLPADRPVP